MRRLTLMLFQLFLSIFAVYAVLYDVPNEYLVCAAVLFSGHVLPGTAPKSCLQKKALRGFWQIPKVHCSLYPKPPLILTNVFSGVFFSCHFFPCLYNLGIAQGLSTW